MALAKRWHPNASEGETMVKKSLWIGLENFALICLFTLSAVVVFACRNISRGNKLKQELEDKFRSDGNRKQGNKQTYFQSKAF